MRADWHCHRFPAALAEALIARTDEPLIDTGGASRWSLAPADAERWRQEP